MWLPVAVATLSLSAASEAAPGEVAHPRAQQGLLPEVERAAGRPRRRSRTSCTCRAEIAWKLSMSHTRRAGERGHPSPPQDVVERQMLVERARGALQGRGRGGVAVGDQRARARRAAGRADAADPSAAGGPGRRGRSRGGRPAGDGAGHLGRAPRRQVGLAGEIEVERLEPAGGGQQQRRRVAPEAGREGDLGPHQVDPCPLELVDRRRLRGRQHGRARRRTRRPGGWPAPPPALARRGATDRRSARPRAAGTPPPPRRRRGPAPGRRSVRAPRPPPRSVRGVPWARCQARRSGSVSGSVASARARCTRWRSSVGAER